MTNYFFTFFFNELSSSFDDEDASFELWIVVALDFDLWKFVYLPFFLNGLCEIWQTSSLDDEDAPFDLLDACSFRLNL